MVGMSDTRETNGQNGTTTRLEAGMTAPDFTLPDDQGGELTLSSLRGGRVILYFYPAAMTPGCTKEACDFRDRLDRLTAAGYTVVGVSKDSLDRLARFRERDGLTFPLLSDPDLTVHRQYGAYGEKKLYGKVRLGVIRSTFVIDESGTIELARYNVRATGHVDSLLRQLAKMD
ncbi:peroxiredoxin [Bifidobacterium margollesii]|uniref:thioredoxin-dependent peroxiredoxin n=1 Tax=Bifidobacterium margollesii TaxID=2020964 RepID=A0A2N5J824_9BIFI|nr:peroxiredoxin [Bifidobacterium margollesii]